MFKIKWLAMLPALTALGCAPHYYHIGLPTAAQVGQKGPVLNDGHDLSPCTTTGTTQGQCVYYVNECDQTGLHTVTIQRVKKGIRVRAYCVVPNAVVPPVTTALDTTNSGTAPIVTGTDTSDPGPL
jgi:hypothetical protein